MSKEIISLLSLSNSGTNRYSNVSEHNLNKAIKIVLKGGDEKITLSERFKIIELAANKGINLYNKEKYTTWYVFK